MSQQFAPASRNPADNGTLSGLLRVLLKKYSQNVDDMLPARVIAYNRVTNRAQVQPLISMVTTGGIVVARAQVASVPVYMPGGGGFLRRDPLPAGSLGWLKANDRDISLFIQTYQQSPPNTSRMHKFADAVFLPDVMNKGVTLASEDANNSVWQNLAGTVKISLWNNLIKILAPLGVGIGGTPNPHAILDLQSTTQAFLPPRMTQGQRDAIASPQEGMMVWNLTTHGISTYDGSAWS